MNTIFIRYEALSASWVGDAVTGQEKTLKCKFIFDEKWDSYPIRYMIVSREGKIFDPVLIDESNEAIVHGEALTDRAHIMIGAVGLAVKNGETLRYNGRPCRIRVDQGNLIWEPSTEEEATAYEKLLVEVIELEKAVAAKLDSNQGTANAGRVLVVGEDGKVTTEEQLQADWDQNDSTAKDYVKNRTHWADLQYSKSWLNHYEVNPLAAGIGIHPLVIAMEGKEDFSFDRFLEPEYLRTILSVKITFTVASYGEMDFTDTFFRQIKFIDDYNYKSLLNSVQGYEIYCIRKVTALSEQYREMFTANGAYLRVFEGTGELKASRVAFRCLKFNQLDERYIPDTIARTADIKNLPKTNAEEIALLIETDTLPAVKNADGKLLSMGNKIIMRH